MFSVSGEYRKKIFWIFCFGNPFLTFKLFLYSKMYPWGNICNSWDVWILFFSFFHFRSNLSAPPTMNTFWHLIIQYKSWETSFSLFVMSNIKLISSKELNFAQWRNVVRTSSMNSFHPIRESNSPSIESLSGSGGQ